jgi:kynurenine formamidase
MVAMSDDLPQYDQLPVREGAPPGSAWGLWGDPDYFGSLNLLTPERAVAATQSVRSGKSFGLNLDFATPNPPLFGRQPWRHEVVGPLGGGHDDILHNFNTQASSQWDGFRHVAHPEHGHYGGVPDQDHGMHHWSERGLVGRGILADVERWRSMKGRPIDQRNDDVIPVTELAECLADQGTEIRTGDILLVRTGWLSWYRSLERSERNSFVELRNFRSSGVEPGMETVAQMWNWHIAALAADNPAVETLRGLSQDVSLHRNLLPLLGIPLGELFELDPLAEECASSRHWDFLFVSAPINVRGGVATPPNAVAIC